MSSGGLVSALSGLKKETNFTWFGWPGIFVDPKEQPRIKKELRDNHSSVPVFLNEKVADMHYNGFSYYYLTLATRFFGRFSIIILEKLILTRIIGRLTKLLLI
jgi:trehalose-6-phosphate synthase